MIEVKVTRAFFDKDAITNRINIRKRAALSKAGAFIRRTAKSSLKYAPLTTYSSAGQPPKVHRGSWGRNKTNKKTGVTKRVSLSPLRELLYFAYDTSIESVVVGPANTAAPNDVVKVLEKGGTISVTKGVQQPTRGRARSPAQAQAYRNKILSGAIIPPKVIKNSRQVTIAARPTMVPAMKSQPREILAQFKDMM